MNISVSDAANAMLRCRPLQEELGFELETGVTPLLEIAHCSPNVFLGEWTARSNSLCCNETAKIKELEDGFYLVCRRCESVPPVELTCGVFTQYGLEDWVPHLLPSSWNLLEKSIYAPPIIRTLNVLGNAIQEAGLMMEKAAENYPELSYPQLLEKHQDSRLAFLNTVAQTVNGTQF